MVVVVVVVVVVVGVVAIISSALGPPEQKMGLPFSISLSMPIVESIQSR